MRELDDLQTMIAKAMAVRKLSYAPYSKFHVGACIETVEGEQYTGCNVENASFSVTNCAERTAIFKAVSEGKRNFTRIVIVGGYDKITDYCPPCGVCLQVMMEFCNPDKFQIILAKSISDYQTYTLKEMLPYGFGPAHLE